MKNLLFCFDKENSSTDYNFNITEIFGGRFSKTSVKTLKSPQISYSPIEKFDLKGKPFNYVKKAIDKRIRDLSNKYELKTDSNSQLYKNAQKVINLFKQESIIQFLTV